MSSQARGTTEARIGTEGCASAADAYTPTARTTFKRRAERGTYDKAAVHAILDEAFVCHVGFAVDGRPFVIPTAYARVGDRLLLHGSASNHMLRALAAGAEACVTVTLVDGLVLARSAFHHSMNYRSVVLFGKATEITDFDEKLHALRAVVEHVAPGRWDSLRPPKRDEVTMTKVLALPIEEAAAKVRVGSPIDDEPDYALPIWAGVLPLSTALGAPQPCPRMAPDVAVPPEVSGYARPRSGSAG
jgi:nitroimidazol reductase NimA-like FMN-containing flavoprotein (pyridoxamine 5'-phosphate oxidase superfamily)